MVTPSTVYDYDIATGSLTLLKQQPVLPSPAGVRVPLRRLRAVPRVGGGRRRHPGADLAGVPQGHAARRVRALPAVRVRQLRALRSTPSFSISRLSLLDRGFVFAIAHVRGGGELGRPWYDHGKMLEKKNTFTDFVACAAHLVAARLDVGVPAGGARRFGGRAADGRGGQPGARRVRRDRRAGAVRGRAEHDPRPVAAADRDRVGGVGRPAARPRGVRVHEVVHAVRERAPGGLPADLRADRPERHPGALPRARQVDGAAARRRLRRPVPAEDRDGGGARRPQRPLRRLAGGGARARLDHRDGDGRPAPRDANSLSARTGS